jgi:hypothetical protein
MQILTSHVFSTVAKILAFAMPVFIMLYLVVEFVERMDGFLQGADWAWCERESCHARRL